MGRSRDCYYIFPLLRKNCHNTVTFEECGSKMETKQESWVQTFGDCGSTKQEGWQATTDLGDPTYWLSYEYKEIQSEMVKLNEKMDLILLQKKPKKSTIVEVDKKVDSLINILKKRKFEE